MLEQLKEKVWKANLQLPAHGLVTYTWGNVSEIDRQSGLVVIKPSGVSYDEMKPEDMVVVDLKGATVEGKLRPSSDTPTHLELYKNFPQIGGIVHTHSTWATIFAQCGRGIPAFGTTHADYFFGEIPCTEQLTREEIEGDYEKETGSAIVRAFYGRSPADVPAVLVKEHGPFTWGEDCDEAVYHGVVLEEVAKMAYYTILMKEGEEAPMFQALLDKHYLRKHGVNAYYGQENLK